MESKIRQIVTAAEVASALLAWFLVAQGAAGAFGWFNITDPLARSPFPLSAVLGLASAVGVFLTLRLHAGVQGWATLVVEELAQVKWPSYEETRLATIVVIGFVAVLTALLGVLDWTFSSLTSLIYL